MFRSLPCSVWRCLFSPLQNCRCPFRQLSSGLHCFIFLLFSCFILVPLTNIYVSSVPSFLFFFFFGLGRDFPAKVDAQSSCPVRGWPYGPRRDAVRGKLRSVSEIYAQRCEMWRSFPAVTRSQFRYGKDERAP